jgi:hypothetical protein
MAAGGIQGNQMKEARVFGHHAKEIVESATQITGTTERGCCLYVGGAGDVKVTMESGVDVTFKGVNAGTFLPILITHVLDESRGSGSMFLIAIF